MNFIPEFMKFDNYTMGLAQIIIGLATLIVTIFGAIYPILESLKNKHNLTKKLKLAAFDKETIKRSTRYFIRTKCSNIDPAQEQEIRHALIAISDDLFKTIDKFIKEDTRVKHLLILADSGTGKTTFVLNYYAYNLKKSSRKSFQIAVVPLGHANADQMIRDIKNRENKVIFLDAFDEDTQAISDHHKRIESLIHACQGFRRVIITCRTQFFKRDEEIPVDTGIVRIGPRKAGVKPHYEFRKLYLSPFDDQDVRRYLTKRYPFWRYGLRKKALDIALKIPLLSARPMLLAHIPDLISYNAKITYSYELYDVMIEAWLERESLWADKEILRKFSERLAIDIFENRESRGMERVSYNDLKELAKIWNLEIEDWKLSGRSLLNRDAEGNFKFAHRSIMEYLYVKRVLSLKTEDRPNIEFTDQMKVFLIEKLKHGTAGKNLAKVDLGATDLLGFDLKGIDFSYSNFERANLANADLTCVDLTRCNLKECNLTGADLSHTDLSEVDLSEIDCTSINLEHCKFKVGNCLINSELNMKFVYIPCGEFIMGSPENEPERSSDEKQHKVTITTPFFLQTTQVTQAQWKAIMGTNPSYFKDSGQDAPVENVSWNDAKEFIEKLNMREGKNLYRLPTEAEWEYACRAGTNTPFYFGNCLSTDQANYNGNYPMSGCEKGEYRKKTVTTGSFVPNAWGLYDMHGNVWEWCEDWYGDYPDQDVTYPIGPGSGSNRVLRGGSCFNFAGNCRSAVRDRNVLGNRNNNVGFRVLRSLP